MKCPTCGNEVTQGEVFCGQCGTPSIAVPPGYQGTNMPSPRSGLLSTGAYSPNTAFVPPPNTYQPGTFAPAQTPSPHLPSGALPPTNPYQQTGFYHNATEAMPPVQHAPSGLLPGYSQQFPGVADPTRGQFTPQAAPVTYPFQTGNYGGPMPTQQPFSTGQSYNYGPQGQFPPPPQKQSNQIILIVCIVLVVVLLGAVGITTVALLNRPATNKSATLPTAAPTIAPTVAPTVAPTPTIVPTPSPAPTPAADAGFAWCGTNCNQYGFTTEFPVDWQGIPIPNTPGVQFTNPTMPNVSASFKTPGPTGDTPANVLMNDVQNTFGSQPGYAAPTPPATANATIGGAAWYAISTSYNTQNQPIRVEVYATVYQGKAYLIELQAPASNDQFDSVKQQFFVNMLVKFQFQPTAQ
jgi:hypothetical protein